MVPSHNAGNVGASFFECGAGGTRCSDSAKKGALETTRQQPNEIQSTARPCERLSCPEIRHLFWQLVLAAERSTRAMLNWSWWRRKHGARAQAAHYARREREQQAEYAQTKPPSPHPERGQQQQAVVEEVWKRLVELLPSKKRTGRPIDHDRRVILDAIVYVMQTGCGWRGLPAEFPPWQTVYSQRTQWRTTGVWEKIWAGCTQPCPHNQLQL